MLRKQSVSEEFSEILGRQLALVAATLDPVLEHGQTEGAVGHQQRRAGGGGHLGAGLANAAAELLFGEDAPSPAAAAEAVAAVLRHLGDRPAGGGEEGPGSSVDVGVAANVARIVVGAGEGFRNIQVYQNV